MTNLENLMNQTGITMNELVFTSGVSDTTLRALLNGRREMENCEAGTVKRIADSLGVSMECLLSDDDPNVEKEVSMSIESLIFQHFRAKMLLLIASMPISMFVECTCRIDEKTHTDLIHETYEQGFRMNALYLLALVDYLCRRFNQPLPKHLDDLRCKRLDHREYPFNMIYYLVDAENIVEHVEHDLATAIPEFARVGFVETEEYINDLIASFMPEETEVSR